MKYISFVDVEQPNGEMLNTKLVIEKAMNYAGPGGVVYEEMRKRNRIWDALDTNKDPVGLLLEDADFAILCQLIKSYPFGAAGRHLTTLVKGILSSKAPTAVQIPGVTKEEKEEPKE